MKSRARKPLLLALVASGLTTTITACNPATYFASLFETSRVSAVVSAPGLLAWSYRRQRDSGTILEGSGKVTVTPPVISLTPDDNSSPIRYTNAQVQFFDPSAGAVSNSGRVTYPSGSFANPVVLALPVVLMQKNRATAVDATSVTLNGIITQDLINRTDLSAATGSAIPTITAQVRLIGNNDFGARADTTINVPINVVNAFTDVD